MLTFSLVITLLLKVMLFSETLIVLVFSDEAMFTLCGVCVIFCTSTVLLCVDLLSRLKLDPVGNENHDNI